MSTVYVTPFDDNPLAVKPLMTAAGLGSLIEKQQTILVKPNLVQAIDPPVTTRADIVDALLSFIRGLRPGVRIIIAEGVGSWEVETDQVFRRLGYDRIARKHNASLLDLNHAPCRTSRCDSCTVWPEMVLPDILFESFVISVPTLKAHSLASATLSMKNMMGAAPHSVYGKDGAWRKARFHDRIQETILDLNRHRAPDFVVMDATVGMSQAHLYGPPCDPPVNRLAASSDPVAIDAWGARMLGRDPRKIGHIAMADGGIGSLEYTVSETATA